jgi:ribosomal protein L15
MSGIQEVFNLRTQRQKEYPAKIAGTVRSHIEDIKRQVKTGVDGDGWHKVISGWRSNETTVSKGPSAPSYKHDGGHGGHGSHGGHGGHGGHGKHGAYNNSSRMKNDLQKPTPIRPGPSAPAQPYKRYESRFKNSEQNVESTIVNTIILGKLNKFSPQNYVEVYEFLSEILATGECDFLADFMKLIFTKAATEETFCPLYARLLKELSSKYTFLLTEMDDLYKKFLDIFEEIEDDDTTTNTSAINKRNEKKYRLGYSQFLAELLKQNVMDVNAFYITIEQIIKQIDIQTKKINKTHVIEEYADCLIRILKVLKNTPNTVPTDPTSTNTNCENKCFELKVRVRETLRDKMQELTRKSDDRPSLNNKVRFTMMDCTDAIN